MATRKVFGTILDGKGSPWIGRSVVFGLRKSAWTSQAQYPRSRAIAKTNAQGYFETDLWIDLEGVEQVPYTCKLPDGSEFDFLLAPSTSPAELSSLRGTAPVPKPLGSFCLPGPKGEKGDTGSAGTAAHKEQFFTAADLTPSNSLVCVHGFGKIPTSCRVLSPIGEQLLVPVPASNTITAVIDLEDFVPIVGTYLLILGA
jgi:hypothetical protein